MKTFARSIALLLLMCASSAPVYAAPEDKPTALAMTGDILIARPVGIAITAVGAAAFVVSLPFTALGGNVGEAADTLVGKPARETFVRCLGCKTAGRARNNR